MKISPESSGLAGRSEEISPVWFCRIGIYGLGLCECKLYYLTTENRYFFASGIEWLAKAYMVRTASKGDTFSALKDCLPLALSSVVL